MKASFLIIICFFCIESFCQDDFNEQYRLIKANIQKPFETFNKHTIVSYKQLEFEKDTFLIDHIVRKYSGPEEMSRFISNRYLLPKFKNILLIQNSAVLEYNGHNKKITVTTDKITKSLGSLGVIQYDSTVFNGKRTTDDFTFISSINSKEIYGLKWDTSTVTVLSSIIVTIDDQKYMINESAFNDLYFPSLCEIAYNERPIEAYMSPNKKCIYIYITGGQPGANYFCKIIFDIESKKTVGRMIAESHELSWYRAVNNDFIGF